MAWPCWGLGGLRRGPMPTPNVHDKAYTDVNLNMTGFRDGGAGAYGRRSISVAATLREGAPSPWYFGSAGELETIAGCMGAARIEAAGRRLSGNVTSEAFPCVKFES